MRITSFALLLISVATLAYISRGAAWRDHLEGKNGWSPFFEEEEFGNQVLHEQNQNKDYHLHPDAVEFVEKYLGLAIPCQSDSEVIRIGSDYVAVHGEFMALGIGVGKAVNFIAALNPTQKIYCFDGMQKGVPFPPFLHNIVVKRGLFKETLPDFVLDELEGGQVAFIFMNCNHYNSCREVFNALKDHIVDQTVIVFDELYNYPGFEHHELKALQEFLEENGFNVEYIAYNVVHEQVAVRLHKKWALSSFPSRLQHSFQHSFSYY